MEISVEAIVATPEFRFLQKHCKNADQRRRLPARIQSICVASHAVRSLLYGRAANTSMEPFLSQRMNRSAQKRLAQLTGDYGIDCLELAEIIIAGNTTPVSGTVVPSTRRDAALHLIRESKWRNEMKSRGVDPDAGDLAEEHRRATEADRKILIEAVNGADIPFFLQLAEHLRKWQKVKRPEDICGPKDRQMFPEWKFALVRHWAPRGTWLGYAYLTPALRLNLLRRAFRTKAPTADALKGFVRRLPSAASPVL